MSKNSHNDESSARRALSLQEAASVLTEYSVQQWFDWTKKFLVGELCDPLVIVDDEEPHHVLAKIYNDLNNISHRDRLAEAIKITFETTPIIQQNAREHYYLIELLSYVKPLSAKSLVRRYLKERSFLNINYGQQNLHTMLLVANSKYDIDEELLDFIHDSSQEIKDFKYLLICLRLLSLASIDEFILFLDTLLPHLRSNNDALRLGRQLKGVFYRAGYRHFCNWYSAKALTIPIPAPVPPDARDRPLLQLPNLDSTYQFFYYFDHGLKEIPFRKFDPEHISMTNPHYAMIAAQVHSYDYSFNANEILALARLHKRVTIPTTINALINIWHRNTFRTQDRQPWWYPSPNEQWGLRNMARNIARIYSGGNGNKPAEFEVDEEPEVALIFEKVKSACEVGVIFKQADISDRGDKVVAKAFEAGA